MQWQWKDIKITIIIIVFVFGLAAFGGAQYIYNQYSFERPLANLLEGNKDILTYSISEKESVLEISVKLVKTDNLQMVYSDLNKKISNLAGKRKYEILLQDQTDETLKKIHSDGMVAAYEAIDRGNYLEMKTYITKLAAVKGANARVWIDQDNLYLQLEHGNSYYQEIIPRIKPNNSSQNAEGWGTF